MVYGPVLSVLFLLGTINYASLARPDFDCPRADGMFANPVTCRRFYMCHENYPYEQTCPPGLYFDDEQKHCAHKTKDLKCGPLPLPDLTTTPPDELAATKCDLSKCSLPKCFCSRDGLRTPGGLKKEDIPKMITISFDGALNTNNIEHYEEIIDLLGENPNGCPASVTFFVTHSYSNYSIVQNMANKGHEIGLNGIFGKEPETWWETATTEEWIEHMEGERQMLVKFANLKKEDIVGMRAPFIRNGGNDMLAMMKEIGLMYDSSMPVATRSPIWPYTFDYKIPHTCIGTKRCPTRKYEGIWEYPMNMLFSEDGTGGLCALAAQCVFVADADQVGDFLTENFDRHNKNDTVPFGVYLHANWFLRKEKIEALKKFIKDARDSGAYFVSIKKALDWVKRPRAGDDHPAFDCKPKPDRSCKEPNNCELNFIQDKIEDTRYMSTCAPCPSRYPWVGNPKGLSRFEEKEVSRNEEAEVKPKKSEEEEYFENGREFGDEEY